MKRKYSPQFFLCIYLKFETQLDILVLSQKLKIPKRINTLDNNISHNIRMKDVTK